MASNIQVNVTADTTQIRAQLALAQQDLKAYQTQLRQAAADIKASGQASAEQSEALNRAAAGVNDAKSKVNSLSAELQKLIPASNEAGGAINHGLTREIMVLMHELSQGNINRAAGSFMVLGERANFAGGMMAVAAVGGGALIGRQLLEVAADAMKAAQELRNVANAAVLQGRSGVVAMAQAKAGAEQIATAGTVSSSAAAKISNAIQNLNNVSDQTRQTLTQLGPALNMALGGGDADKTAEKIEGAFGDTSRLEAFLRANNLLTDSQRQAFEAAQQTKDAYGAQAIAMDALKARLGPAQAAFIQQKQYADQQASLSALSAAAPGGAGEVTAAMTTPEVIPPKTLEVPGTTAPSAQDQQATAIEEEHLGQLREQQALQSQLEVLQRRLTGETDETSRSQTQAAIQDIQSQQAMLKARGDTSWEQKQELAVSQAVTQAEQGAKTRQAAELAGAKATLAAWQSAAQQQGITEQQKTEALLHASQERQRIQMMELGEGASSAKRGVQEQIAALSAQQAADTKNYDSWMAIEQQKLSALRQAYGERSAQYQEELRREEEYERQSADRKRQIDLETISSENAVGARRLQATIQELQAELAQQGITKAEEVSLAQQAVETEYQAEAGRLSSLIASLDKETDAYRKATEEKNKLDAQHQAVVEQYNREAAAAAAQTAQRQQQVYQQAFEGISSSASNAFSGYMSGSETWLRAEQQVGRSILSSFTSMAQQMASRWAATQLAEQMASKQTQSAVAVAQEQGQSGLWQLLSRSVGLTTASQAGQTAAVTSGVTARQSIQSSAEAQGAAVHAATGAKTVMSDAATAFSGTYSSVSQIPFVGWILAPAAAAAAFAAVAAYSSLASFDTGSWEVPHDMVAQIHQGEMIVPRTYAESMRSNGGAGGGNGGSSSSVSATYAPTFHGAGGGDMRAQSRRDFEAMKRWTVDQTRNGRLAVRGR